VSTQAMTADELANQAQDNFQAGKYSEAISEWKQLEGMRYVNGVIYNNLGSAYWRLGQAGQARRYFLMAKKIAPRDSSIRANLQFITKKVEKPVSEDDLLALLKKIPIYLFALNDSESLIISTALSVLVFGLFFIYRLKGKTSFRTWGFIFLIPFIWSLPQLIWHLNQNYFSIQAVTVVPKSGLLDSPVLSSKVLEEITEGALLEIIKKEGDFALVKTSSGREGWLEKGNIGEID
jgi:tetratricopeptide (TPR) repeat protein